jgi:hypothetical protein
VTHAGYMIDDPLDRDVAEGGRTRQHNAYGNVMYVHNRYLQIEFEVAHLWAGFKGTTNQDNEAWVFQNKIIFTF